MAVARNTKKIFDLGRSFPNRPRTAAEQVRPRWFGHDLSGVPDSGIGRSEDGKTRGGRVGHFGQSTFQPTIPQPIRRKRRACGVRHVSEPFLVRKVRTVYRLLVMLRRPSRGGHQTTSIRKRPSLRGWTWLTWWRLKWRSSGQSPDLVAPEKVGDSPSALGLVRIYVDAGTHVCGGSIACVSPRRGRPQRGPAGAGTPAGVAGSFADGAL